MNKSKFSNFYLVLILLVIVIGFIYYFFNKNLFTQIPDRDLSVEKKEDVSISKIENTEETNKFTQETNVPVVESKILNNLSKKDFSESIKKFPTPSVSKSKCINNPTPIFTNHITDISKVGYVVPPPTMGSGPSLKTHSYIGTNGVSVPVYAPVAMVLKDGSYYVNGPYLLDFEVSCEVTVRFGHMTNPVDSIKKLFSSEPATDSRTHELSPISFKAGELIGYTIGTSGENSAGNWDFGVYNSSITNRYINDPDWNNSTTYTTALCPFDYFMPNLRIAYTSKFNYTNMGGNPPDGESFCK